MSRFDFDTICALRAYERGCMKKGDVGLAGTVSRFVNYVQNGGRFEQEIPAGFSLDNWTTLLNETHIVGWNPNEVIAFIQNRELLSQVLSVHRGLAEIKPVRRILDCSKPFDVAAFFNDQDWSAWLGPINGDGKSGDPDLDPRALTLTTVDFAQVNFLTCLAEGQNSIKGEDKLLLLKQQTNLIRHGGQQFQALWNDYQQNKERSVLEWLRRTKGITYLDFMGLILRYPHGNRCVLCLYWKGGCWRWGCRWLGRGWLARNFSVVSPASIGA